MNRTALTGVILAIVAAFAALTVSIVDARRPLDDQVRKSFRAVALKAGGIPFDCVKTRIDYYDCVTLMRPRLGGREQRIHYTLGLRGDGCWSAPVTSIVLQQRFRELEGCTG